MTTPPPARAAAAVPTRAAARGSRITGCATLGMALHETASHAGASIDSALPATHDSHGSMARGALLVLADQALACGVFAAFGGAQAMLTLDLRVDWLALPPPGALIAARVERVIRHGLIVAVQGVIEARSGAASVLVATACARFLTGSLPGGGDIMVHFDDDTASAS
ncbi:MAG: hypothetical protein ACRCUI_13120, partial [Polymorphobacter sp.]